MNRRAGNSISMGNLILSKREWPLHERWYGMRLALFYVLSPLAAWFMVNEHMYFYEGKWTGGGEPEGAD